MKKIAMNHGIILLSLLVLTLLVPTRMSLGEPPTDEAKQLFRCLDGFERAEREWFGADTGGSTGSPIQFSARLKGPNDVDGVYVLVNHDNNDVTTPYFLPLAAPGPCGDSALKIEATEFTQPLFLRVRADGSSAVEVPRAGEKYASANLGKKGATGQAPITAMATALAQRMKTMGERVSHKIPMSTSAVVRLQRLFVNCLKDHPLRDRKIILPEGSTTLGKVLDRTRDALDLDFGGSGPSFPSLPKTSDH